MSKLHFTTKHANEATVKRNWYVVDGTNQTVGRMCARIAAILRGKNKASYTPHVDTGDYIIVINAEKVVFTGNKLQEKMYDHFTGYPGGLKEESAINLQNYYVPSSYGAPTSQSNQLLLRGVLPFRLLVQQLVRATLPLVTAPSPILRCPDRPT